MKGKHIHNGISTEVIQITPELATSLLESFEDNRYVRPGLVQRIATDIQNGRWQVNGQPILITEKGELIDGQHRCLGIVKAGKPVKALVVRGVSKAAFATIDSGHSRGLNDAFQFMGEKYPMRLATAVRLAWQLSQRKFSRDNNPTRSQSVDFLKDNHGIADSITLFAMLSVKVMPPATAAALHFMFHRKDAGMADQFAHVLIDGKILPQPFHALRERMLSLREMPTETKRQMTVHYAIKCWNAARDGKKVTHLHIARDEEVPRIE